LDLPRTELKLNLKAENNTIDYGTITKGKIMALEYLNLLIPVPHPNYLCGSIHSKLHCPIKTNDTVLPRIK
jgi:hypothetical protein